MFKSRTLSALMLVGALVFPASSVLAEQKIVVTFDHDGNLSSHELSETELRELLAELGFAESLIDQAAVSGLESGALTIKAQVETPKAQQ